LAVGFSIEKSGDISESALFVIGASQIEGHRPYFGLPLEESWVASPEFPLLGDAKNEDLTRGLPAKASL